MLSTLLIKSQDLPLVPGEFSSGQSLCHHVSTLLEHIFSKTLLSIASPLLLEFPAGFHDQLINTSHG